MNKPDKEKINELERKLADSWRTAKNLKDEYDSMNAQEVMLALGDLEVDIVLEDDQTLKDLTEGEQ